MYFEEIADLTAAHLRVHIASYITDVEPVNDPKLTLVPPQLIEVVDLLGGVFEVEPKRLPVYGFKIYDREPNTVNENLWDYFYNGAVAAVVGYKTATGCDSLVARHLQVVGRFVREHLYLHQLTGTGFKILQFGESRTVRTGLINVSEDPKNSFWLGGFRIDLVWQVSEDGPGQHL